MTSLPDWNNWAACTAACSADCTELNISGGRSSSGGNSQIGSVKCSCLIGEGILLRNFRNKSFLVMLIGQSEAAFTGGNENCLGKLPEVMKVI